MRKDGFCQAEDSDVEEKPSPRPSPDPPLPSPKPPLPSPDPPLPSPNPPLPNPDPLLPNPDPPLPNPEPPVNPVKEALVVLRLEMDAVWPRVPPMMTRFPDPVDIKLTAC